MGDVYRLVFFLETFVHPFTFRTIAETGSQLVTWQQKRQRAAHRTLESITSMPYEDMVLAKEHFIHTPYKQILAELRTFIDSPQSAHGSPSSSV